MINFREYLQQELTKTNDEQVKNTIVRPAEKEKTIDDIVYEANPAIWTAREVSGIKYLIYNKKKLNITKLKEEINNIYSKNGYTGYGFAKLSEPELVRYTKVKNIIIPLFAQSDVVTELEPATVAQKLYMNEIKDFEWTPEEY